MRGVPGLREANAAGNLPEDTALDTRVREGFLGIFKQRSGRGQHMWTDGTDDAKAKRATIGGSCQHDVPLKY